LKLFFLLPFSTFKNQGDFFSALYLHTASFYFGLFEYEVIIKHILSCLYQHKTTLAPNGLIC